ncbi:MAG TPA: SDR family oxidoreductase [Thermodesulfobacteriota bacterium]|nr:SDR family oxidoreductase [Thermodesulfobacteriota bacterium]
MEIVIFGASGRTGVELVKQALDQDHSVVAFVRNPTRLRIRHKNLSVAEANVLDKEQVENAVGGCEGVLYAIGVMPWKRPVCTEGIKNVISAMHKHNVRRLIAESAYGVKETRKGVYGRSLWVIIKDIMRDKETMEDAISASQLDWVIVRPTILTQGAKTGRYRVGQDLRVGILPRISRADVADFMIKQLQDDRFIHQAPSISY